MVGMIFIPHRPFADNRHLGRVYGACRRIVMIVVAAMAVLFFAYVFGSFIFTGGQVASTEQPRYDALLAFPLFTPPVALVIALDVVVGVASVVMAVTARRSAVGDLPFLIVIPTVIMSMFSLGLSYFLRDARGPLVAAKWGETNLSFYWIGVPFVIAGALALVIAYVRLVVLNRRDRERLPELEGYDGGDLSRYREMLTGDPEASREELEQRAKQMLDEIDARARRNREAQHVVGRRAWRDAQRRREGDDR